MKRDRTVYIAVCIFAAALIAAISTRVFEIRTETVEGREGRAAARDPWLALDRALAGTREVKRYSALADIDFGSAALVVAEGKSFVGYDEESRDWDEEEEEGGAETEEAPLPLSEWVAGGGRLVLAWDDPPEEKPSLLADFAFGVPATKDESGRCRARGRFRGSLVEVDASRLLYFPEVAGEKGVVRLYDGDAARIAIGARGAGWTLAGAKPLFLENRRLADPGNLAFASALLGDLPAGAAWLPEPPRAAPPAPSGGLAAKAAFIPVAAAGLLFCLALLWSRAPRFGPAIPEPSADRRGLMERFRAEGRFLFAHGADGRILARAGAGAGADGREGKKAGRRARADRILRAVDALAENTRNDAKGETDGHDDR